MKKVLIFSLVFLLICSVVVGVFYFLDDEDVKGEEIETDNAQSKDGDGIKSSEQLLKLLGFEESFDIYDIRYVTSSLDAQGSTTICFKTYIGYTDMIKKHSGYYEGYIDDNNIEPDFAVDGIFFENIQKCFPESERIPFDYVVKTDVLFQDYSVKTGDNSESITTNSTNWYLIDDGAEKYIFVVNIIPEAIELDMPGAVSVTQE